MSLAICLWFNGNARAAAEFYVSNLPDGEIEENWITPAQTPGNEVNSEVLVRFRAMGQEFIALNGGPQFTFSEAVSFVISCKNQAEIDHYWRILGEEGGEPGQCGWLKDKFGVSWQIVSPLLGQYIGGPDREGATRATQAMLEMKKLDLAALKAAYDGA